MTKPILKFNRATGKYEGVFTLQIEAEIFRRLLFQYANENNIDPADLDAWQRAIAATAQVGNWLNHPHATITEMEERSIMPVHQPTALTQPSTLQERLCAIAQQTPPHLWEERCLTPTGDKSLPLKERDNIGRLRWREREVLKTLRTAWQNGEFALTPEADAQERAYRGEEQTKLNATLNAVATAVNGVRHQ